MDITEYLLGQFTVLMEGALEEWPQEERFLLGLTITPFRAERSTQNITPYSRQVLISRETLSSTLQSLRVSSAQTSSSTSE